MWGLGSRRRWVGGRRVERDDRALYLIFATHETRPCTARVPKKRAYGVRSLAHSLARSFVRSPRCFVRRIRSSRNRSPLETRSIITEDSRNNDGWTERATVALRCTDNCDRSAGSALVGNCSRGVVLRFGGSGIRNVRRHTSTVLVKRRTN